jgi:hypothetical protein
MMKKLMMTAVLAVTASSSLAEVRHLPRGGQVRGEFNVDWETFSSNGGEYCKLYDRNPAARQLSHAERLQLRQQTYKGLCRGGAIKGLVNYEHRTYFSNQQEYCECTQYRPEARILGHDAAAIFFDYPYAGVCTGC